MSDNTQLTKAINDGEPEPSSFNKSNHSNESFSVKSASSDSSIEQGNKDMLIEYMVIIEVVIVVMVECVVIVANQQSAVVK